MFEEEEEGLVVTGSGDGRGGYGVCFGVGRGTGLVLRGAWVEKVGW